MKNEVDGRREIASRNTGYCPRTSLSFPDPILEIEPHRSCEIIHTILKKQFRSMHFQSRKMGIKQSLQVIL